MALNTIADLSVTTASNVDVIGQPTLGSADANQLDAVDRSILALLARFYSDLGGVVTVGGSANAITITSASTYQALEDGLVVSFKAGAANTGATTLNLDGLGAKAVRRRGDAALEAGDIAANGRYLVVYDAAYNSSNGAWVLMNPQSIGAASTDTLTNKTLTSPAINTPTLVLKQGSAPTPTVEGDIQWDTDDDIIVIGDGASQKRFYPLLTGSWTPAMTFGGSATGVTYSTQSGTYIKIGRFVHIEGHVTLTNNGSGSGDAKITGLPYAPTNGFAFAGFAYWGGTTGFSGTLTGGLLSTSEIALRIGSASGSTTATDSNITGISDLYFSGSYYTAS